MTSSNFFEEMYSVLRIHLFIRLVLIKHNNIYIIIRLHMQLIQPFIIIRLIQN